MMLEATQREYLLERSARGGVCRCSKRGPPGLVGFFHIGIIVEQKLPEQWKTGALCSPLIRVSWNSERNDIFGKSGRNWSKRSRNYS